MWSSFLFYSSRSLYFLYFLCICASFNSGINAELKGIFRLPHAEYGEIKRRRISYLIVTRKTKYWLLSEWLDKWIRSPITKQLGWPWWTWFWSAVWIIVNHCLFLCLGIDSVMHRQSCGIFIQSPCLAVPINTWIYEPVCNIFYTQLPPGGHLLKSIPLIRRNSHWVLVNLLVIEEQDKYSSLIN